MSATLDAQNDVLVIKNGDSDFDKNRDVDTITVSFATLCCFSESAKIFCGGKQ